MSVKEILTRVPFLKEYAADVNGLPNIQIVLCIIYIQLSFFVDGKYQELEDDSIPFSIYLIGITV